MRIMALDYGEKRVGIAITDPLGIISQPLLTIQVGSEKDLIQRLKFIIEENGVGLIIIGNPISHRGEPTKISKKIMKFASKLRNFLNIEVKLWDERFTSKYAARILQDIGIKKGKAAKLDQIAASIMLDEYLKSGAANIT